MRNRCRADIIPRFALESQKPRISGARLERGTEESNLALRFWRPPCYRYTSPPGEPGIVGAGPTHHPLGQIPVAPTGRQIHAENTRSSPVPLSPAYQRPHGSRQR
jgi:hypothetical protein